ncbi:GGDEF domain-containing protein [Kineococcus sp. G2]|uniref:GGDEF domain-containing protein n=1 Tax=Kineococcus sp. G2 TaxID=3127484 RepID=UPI00301DC72B
MPLHVWLEADVPGSFDRETTRALPLAGAGLTVLYLVYLAASLVATARGQNPAPWIPVVLGASAAVLAGSALLVSRRGERLGRRVHAIAGLVGLVPLANSVLLLVGSADPRESVNLLLIVGGAGMLLLSVRWYALTVALAWAGWLTAALAPGAHGYSVFGFGLIASTVLSAVSLVSRRRTIARLERARAEAQRAALVDALTGVYNRRGMEVLAPALLQRAQHAGEVTVVGVDIDDMKGINDTHGHAAGDAAVLGAADVLRRSTRVHDVVARTGGDEFVVLVDAPAGIALRERILANLASHVADSDEPFQLRLSVGVVTMSSGIGLDTLLSAADAAMYEIKVQRRAVRAEPQDGAPNSGSSRSRAAATSQPRAATHASS